MNLKELRKSLKLTQIDIAKYLNVDQKTYSNYENKKTEPTLENLKKLADLYNISIDELVGRKDTNNLGFLSKEQLDIIKKTKKSENNIRKIRNENKLTQQQLASKLNTAQSNLCGWEKGKWQPDIDTIKKLCQILHCSADYLIGLTSQEVKISISKEEPIFTKEQTSLINKIKNLNNIQCIKLEAYADRIIDEVIEKDKN